ncbi:hypothetical protein [Streptomyces sp. PTY087I2]|nr:hypothetical protein [Streptomyces sp. PTY087I2]
MGLLSEVVGEGGCPGREQQAHAVGVVVQLADVGPLGELGGPQGE